MKTLMKMAWMNIWRNKRRTVILLCAMTAGLTGVLFSEGFTKGWLDEMVDNAIRGSGGHIKIHGENYHDNPIVENSMVPIQALYGKLDNDPRVSDWSERVAVQGLISNPRHSVAVTGRRLD